MEQISTEQASAHSEKAIKLLMTYAPKLILAIVALFAGLWIINRMIHLIGKAMERNSAEPTLAKFLLSPASIRLNALLLISVASMVWIETTSFIAILGAAKAILERLVTKT
jgi:small conductance mechanosensitive channel